MQVHTILFKGIATGLTMIRSSQLLISSPLFNKRAGKNYAMIFKHVTVKVERGLCMKGWASKTTATKIESSKKNAIYSYTPFVKRMLLVELISLREARPAFEPMYKPL